MPGHKQLLQKIEAILLKAQYSYQPMNLAVCVYQAYYGRGVYYFFPYTITSNQGIPHDINTMHELWGVTSYRKNNKYLSTACIMEMITALEEGEDKRLLIELQNKLLDKYDKLSMKYHSEKASNENNSLVLG